MNVSRNRTQLSHQRNTIRKLSKHLSFSNSFAVSWLHKQATMIVPVKTLTFSLRHSKVDAQQLDINSFITGTTDEFFIHEECKTSYYFCHRVVFMYMSKFYHIYFIHILSPVLSPLPFVSIPINHNFPFFCC